MSIEWGTLFQVAWVSFAVAVVVVGVFSLGVAAMSLRETATEQGRSGSIPAVGSALCFAACAAVVVYGIYLISWDQLDALIQRL